MEDKFTYRYIVSPGYTRKKLTTVRYASRVDNREAMKVYPVSKEVYIQVYLGDTAIDDEVQ